MDHYARLMVVMGGLRHIRETGKMPDNRAEIDEACEELMKTAPKSVVVLDWLDATKGQRRRSAPKVGAKWR